uniref:Reverse transcriptase domain-containing protein n=1 Tax=Tanacetum cinerariifolium TaxID=118510 RepID=A0A6L2M0R8_TANCI|nr:reverse transcriptase domain-containing protein [Tanacetum cinerariifolium]
MRHEVLRIHWGYGFGESCIKDLESLHLGICVKQIVKPKLRTIIETPVATTADTRTMSELLQAPTKGYGDAIVIHAIPAKDYELKVGLLQLVTLSQFHGFEKDDPQTHIRWFNKIASMLKYKNVPHDAIKLMLFPFSLEGLHRLGLKKNPLVLSINGKILFPMSTTTSSPSPSLDVTALIEVLKELLLMNKATQQATMKAIEETCVIYGGIYNQGGNRYRPQGDPNYHASNQMGPLGFPPSNVQNNQNQNRLESFMDLADLGARMNLIPLFVWKKLSLPDLTPTRMTLELATRSIAYPTGIAEDVFVQVGKFTFPDKFVIIDYDVDPCVLLILGRLFLRTARALVDVHGEELILRDGDEKLIFHADSTLKHPHKHGNESIYMINFINITCEDRFPEVLKLKKSNHPSSGSTISLFDSSPNLTPFETSDSLFEEFSDELALLNPFSPGNEDDNFDLEADLRKIKYLMNQNPLTESNVEIIYPILEKFTDEPALDYLPPPRDDDDDLFDLKSDNDEWKKLLYGDCYKDIDSEKDENKDSKMKLLVVEDHIVESNDLLP